MILKRFGSSQCNSRRFEELKVFVEGPKFQSYKYGFKGLKGKFIFRIEWRGNKAVEFYAEEIQVGDVLRFEGNGSYTMIMIRRDEDSFKKRDIWRMQGCVGSRNFETCEGGYKQFLLEVDRGSRYSEYKSSDIFFNVFLNLDGLGVGRCFRDFNIEILFCFIFMEFSKFFFM